MDEADMVQIDADIIALDPLGPLMRVVMGGPELAAQLSPGRFVLAALNGYLRSVLFPAALPGDGRPTGALVPYGEMEVLVPPDHHLAHTQPGDRINLLGPLGRGYSVAPEVTRLLLVADACRLPVLLPLALEALGRGASVALILSSDTRANLFPIRLLPTALEVHALTADGSAGRQGSMTDTFADLARWADCICIAQDPERYPAFAEIVRQVRLGPAHHFAQALLVPAIACGVGACQGCAVETVHGMRRACTDGPVFDLLDLR